MKSSMAPILFLIISIVNSSCDYSKNNLIGIWFVKEIKLDGKSVNDQIIAEMLIFRADGKCVLPLFEGYQDSSMAGTWKVLSGNRKEFKIEIKSSNPYFNGEFKISFENKAKAIKITSESLYVYCEAPIEELIIKKKHR